MKTKMLLGSCIAGMLLACQCLASPVNINKADAATLAKSLSGVGAVTSKEIVAYRKKNGAFKKPEDLMNVNGIGQKTFDANKKDIRVKN
ncbi:MAG: helix-hairpin-helix domain-containing protein [Arenicellales bacterium]|jgi:competence protein ComEA